MRFYVFILLAVAPLASASLNPVAVANCLQFVITKGIALFFALDANNDLQLTIQDFHDAGDAIARAANFNAEQAKNLHDNVVPTIWDSFHIDDARKGKPVTQAQFVALVCKNQQTRYNEKLDRVGIQTLFTVGDVDGDGFLTADEFANLMTCWKIEAKQSYAVFTVFDVDSDGGFTFDEFVVIFAGYFYGSDPNDPSKMLLIVA